MIYFNWRACSALTKYEAQKLCILANNNSINVTVPEGNNPRVESSSLVCAKKLNKQYNHAMLALLGEHCLAVG